MTSIFPIYKENSDRKIVTKKYNTEIDNRENTKAKVWCKNQLKNHAMFSQHKTAVEIKCEVKAAWNCSELPLHPAALYLPTIYTRSCLIPSTRKFKFFF